MYLVGRFKAGISDLTNCQLLMVGLLSRDDRSVGRQGEVDTGVGYQVGLELSQINVQGPIKPQGGSDGADDLTNQPVQVGVSRARNIKVTTANVIDGLIVNHEGTVRVLQGGVGGQDGVVRLDHSSGDLGCRVDGKFKLGLLSIIHRESFQKQGGKTRSSSAAKGVEDQKPLQTRALVSQLADTIQSQINELFANGVVASGVVVGGILLTGDQLLRVEQLAVGASTDLILIKKDCI